MKDSCGRKIYGNGVTGLMAVLYTKPGNTCSITATEQLVYIKFKIIALFKRDTQEF